MINKIHLGDCIEVMKSIEDKSVDLILCDLPYEMTACSWDIIIPFEDLWKEYKRIRKDNTPILLFGKQPFTTLINMSNLEEFKYEIIWKKQQATNPMCAKQRIMPIHENISVFYKEQPVYNPQMSYGHSCYSSHANDKTIGEIYGDLKSVHRECVDGSRYPTSVLEYNNMRGNAIHPTEKPIDLLVYLIKTFSNKDSIVLDNCSGSGSTAIACLKTDRKFICIEKDENYYNLSVERLKRENIRKKLI